MRYIQPPWENYFFSKVQSAENSLYLSSPYIKDTVATVLCEILRSKRDLNLSVQILTRIRIQDLIDGASDLEAFEKLFQLAELPWLDVEIRCVSNLHAKVYIFDMNSAIVTSANLTPSGLRANVEYGIELTDPIAVQQISCDMDTYWRAAESLTAGKLEQIGERLEATESVVKVDWSPQQTSDDSLSATSSLSIQGIGRRLAPPGQDVENTELDNLRSTISATSTSKYRKRTRVVIRFPEESINVEDVTDVDSALAKKESTIEVESSYGELEETSVEQLISALKVDDKQCRKDAEVRLKMLFALDNSCIVPYIPNLAAARLGLCCRFLRNLPDSGLAVRHLLHMLNMAKNEKGSLPKPILKALNDIAPDRLFSFLCKVVKEPLSNKAKRNAIEELRNAILTLDLQEDDSALEVLQSLTEKTHPSIRNAAYLALGQVGGVKSRDYLRYVFNQAQQRRLPLQTQMRVLQGLIAAGITPDEELIFIRLTYSSNVQFRVISVKALQQIGRKYWERLSSLAASDPNAEVRVQALRALVNIDAAAAHQVLIELSEGEPEDRIKRTIASLIQKCQEPIRELSADEEQTLHRAISDLQSSDPKIRRKAAAVLGKLKHVSAVQPLSAALKDDHGIVRTVAAESLGSIGDNSALFSLIGLLENDSYYHARAAAAKALGLIGDTRAVVAIAKGLKDKSGVVRKWCRWGLPKVSRGRFIRA